MESEFSPDKGTSQASINEYQWDDLRRDRELGLYPWTHLLKPPLEGEITAEDIIRETTPRRSMSREFSRSRTHSPVDVGGQKILNLDSSPGSSRRHGEEGEDEGVQIPNFSKEVSLDSDDDAINQAMNMVIGNQAESPSSSHLGAPEVSPKNVSPKGILKRRVPDQYFGVSETREKTKCCHPLVNKIKHLADKTLNKLEKSECEKSPSPKRKKNKDGQEIRQLKSSPGAVRRQKFSAIKLGDSDEMSKTMSIDTPPPRKKKEHIYEDIEESKGQDLEKTLHFSPDVDKIDRDSNSNKESESFQERKSIASHDPSLVVEDEASLKSEEHIMEKLHKIRDSNKEAILLDEEMDPEEPNVDEIFQNQLDEVIPKNDSPNITITEIFDDDITEASPEHTTAVPIETSPTPSPQAMLHKRNERNGVEIFEKEWSKPSSKLRRWTSEGGTPLEKPVRPTREGSVQVYTPDVRCACQFFQSDSLLPERVNPVGTRPTSRASNLISNESDHEYEIIEKPPPNIVYPTSCVDSKPIFKNDDELSSTTSLERKYLQHTSDEEEQEDKENDEKTEGILNAQILQKDIEERYFVNTPSTISRTECEISTSQVDSSALENLPLKRDSRSKHFEGIDAKIQQRIKEGTGKLKTQAGKLKTKLQNMKSKQLNSTDKPKTNLPERTRFKMPDRPKFTLPDRPKFTLPDKRKFSLPDRPRFKKINISEKLSFGDRKKFTLPERPKFNVPDFSFKIPERTKINFASLGRKKSKTDDTDTTGSNTDVRNVAPVEFEAKTYPRLFNRKKKTALPKTSSSPNLERDETPPPTFTFTRMKKSTAQTSSKTPDSPSEPREYGNTDNFETEIGRRQQFEATYDFDKLDSEYMQDAPDMSRLNENNNEELLSEGLPANDDYSHVINEINNDEFFVRPRGISRENIQVREYLSDEIRQAFKIPKNALALMGSNNGVNDENNYAHEPEADPELMLDDNEPIEYSNEDANERDDGYYTFPPVRPSRAKRKKKELELESVEYIDDNMDTDMQFSEVDLCMPEAQATHHLKDTIEMDNNHEINDQVEFHNSHDLRSIHEYANDDVIEYPDSIPIQSQTLPMPPKRKKKFTKKDFIHSSLKDFKNIPSSNLWDESPALREDVIVYRTEHEYIVPQTETIVSEHSPLPPRRNRSRSSRGTSLCDDDRTSHGAESLTLDTHVPPIDYTEPEKAVSRESPGYATVDKSGYTANKPMRRSQSKTPPMRRRKSNSSDRKYYTVVPTKQNIPDRPPRKKSSTSLMTLDSLTKRSVSADFTQYVEIDEQQIEEIHKDLNSGEVVNKMKDRPLPPPPRPPRGGKRKTSIKKHLDDLQTSAEPTPYNQANEPKIEEIEVSTQTDPLPDDVDFELGIEENLDFSISSSLRDIVNEDPYRSKSQSKIADSPRISRPTSRSEKSFKFSDPKISELSKPNIGRTSPTVILVERRVSSPTRINERDEMLTEASLTVQHIDIDESQIPDVPPLPKPKTISNVSSSYKMPPANDEQALERVTDTSRDVQLDNLVTQRLQVRDLDVGRLNVSELQASKILVSDIEGMTLQVTELDSKSGHISVSGIEFSQSVIDEIVKKFAEISTNVTPSVHDHQEPPRSMSREEHTQTDVAPAEMIDEDTKKTSPDLNIEQPATATASPSKPSNEEVTAPPQRPPPPDLTPLLYSYLQDITMPPTSFYHRPASFRERGFGEPHESQQHQSPPPPARRAKRRPAAPHSESSSDEARARPSPRRMPTPAKPHEPTITEAGAQFLRVCHNSITRTIRNIFNSFVSYVSGTEDKKDVQMALVIFLVLIAGLIMFGLSDSRTIHHHHWEFFNPPDGKQ